MILKVDSARILISRPLRDWRLVLCEEVRAGGAMFRRRGVDAFVGERFRTELGECSQLSRGAARAARAPLRPLALRSSGRASRRVSRRTATMSHSSPQTISRAAQSDRARKS